MQCSGLCNESKVFIYVIGAKSNDQLPTVTKLYSCIAYGCQ